MVFLVLAVLLVLLKHVGAIVIPMWVALLPLWIWIGYLTLAVVVAVFAAMTKQLKT